MKLKRAIISLYLVFACKLCILIDGLLLTNAVR